jgi:DnaK suppressor protein
MRRIVWHLRISQLIIPSLGVHMWGCVIGAETTLEAPMSKQAGSGDSAFLKRQRKRLTDMRNELLKSDAANAARGRAPKPDEAREVEDDAQQMAQGDVDGALSVVEAQRLRSIERALAKIGEGTYGLSDLSGDAIPRARLDAMPEAVLTIQEEDAREKAQRR